MGIVLRNAVDLVDNHHIHGIFHFRSICYSVVVTHKPHSAGDYGGIFLPYPSKFNSLHFSLILVQYLAPSVCLFCLDPVLTGYIATVLYSGPIGYSLTDYIRPRLLCLFCLHPALSVISLLSCNRPYQLSHSCLVSSS